MIKIYIHLPSNLSTIYTRILQNMTDTYKITKNLNGADFVCIYPYTDDLVKYISRDVDISKNISYINNFYYNFSYLFTDNYIQANYLLLDYLHTHDYKSKKYLLYYVPFTKNNYIFLEKIIMIEKHNKKDKCKWLLSDEDLHFQKIIYDYESIYSTIKNYNYNNWRLQKMIYSPKDIIIKCYVLYINNSNGDIQSYNIHKVVYLHASIIAIVDNIYYIADEYFENTYTDYDILYQQIIKIVQHTTTIYNTLFGHIKDKKYTYSLLEYTFHIDSYQHKNKLYLHNIHIVPTIQWSKMLYTLYTDVLLYFHNNDKRDKKKFQSSWIQIYDNNIRIRKINKNNTLKDKFIQGIVITMSCVFIILLLYSCIHSYISPLRKKNIF